MSNKKCWSSQSCIQIGSRRQIACIAGCQLGYSLSTETAARLAWKQFPRPWKDHGSVPAYCTHFVSQMAVYKRITQTTASYTSFFPPGADLNQLCEPQHFFIGLELDFEYFKWKRSVSVISFSTMHRWTTLWN